GPAGYISMEGGYSGGFVPRAEMPPEMPLGMPRRRAVDGDGGEMTEAAIRGFWKAYRVVMDI
ncbi:MAG: hypothetical protein ABWY00_17255, partial [Dongiaceae bacterium]